MALKKIRGGGGSENFYTSKPIGVEGGLLENGAASERGLLKFQTWSLRDNAESYYG